MKNLILATMLGVAFLDATTSQTANAQLAGCYQPLPDFWKRSASNSSSSKRYAIYVYEIKNSNVNNSMPLHDR